MNEYANKKAELEAWAKDDIVPADLQWLCLATVDIINRLETENTIYKTALGKLARLGNEPE